MSDERWFQIRRKRNIELILCLLVVLPMVYGLWFQLAFLIHYMSFLFLVAVFTAIYEGIRWIWAFIRKKEREKAWLCYNK